MNPEFLSKQFHGIAFLVGAKLLEAKRRCDAGMMADSDEGRRLGNEAAELLALNDGFIYAAKLLLPEDDWNQFIYRSALQPEDFEEAVARVEKRIPNIE
jgi:hypothetical protein